MLYLFAVTYFTVLLAEVIGDKSLYTISALAIRFRWQAVLAGLTAAYAGKMLIAVTAGRLLSQLPDGMVALISAATFLLAALTIWRKAVESDTEERKKPKLTQSLAMSFAAVFFTEWGDPGQLAAAALSARYESPVVVWVGATLALITKGLFVLTAGLKLNQYIPDRILRPVAAGFCLTMSFVSLWEYFKG